MKKILYSVTALLGLYLAGCSEADNLAGGGDTQPVVTIYSYDVPADADADATVNLRFIPNVVCDKFYVLTEQKADKDAFIASNGEDAYADRVVAQGVQYPAGPADYLNENLPGDYTITAVGVSASGGKGKSVEFVFNGIAWQLVGTASYYEDASFSSAINGIPAEWYVSTNLETPIYKLGDYYGALGVHGYNIKLSWDNTTGALTFYTGAESPTAGYWRLPTPYNNTTYGAYFAEVDLNPAYTYYDSDNGKVAINFRRVVSAGSFNGWYYMYIELPQ
jgi:hypothetical protein